MSANISTKAPRYECKPFWYRTNMNENIDILWPRAFFIRKHVIIGDFDKLSTILEYYDSSKSNYTV